MLFRSGMVFLSIILFAAPLTAMMHEICKLADARLFACLTLLGFAFTSFWIGLFDVPAFYDQIFWPMLTLGFFLGTFFAPLTVLTLHGLPSRQLIRAAEEAALLRIAAGAFGITLQGVILYRRTPFHQLDLADFFGGRRFASLDLLQQFSTKLENSGLSAGMVTSRLGALIDQQATLVALKDAFLLSSFVFSRIGRVRVARTSDPCRICDPRGRVEGTPRRRIDMIRRSCLKSGCSSRPAPGSCSCFSSVGRVRGV